MITFILLFAAAITSATTVFFWKKADALEYAKAELIKQNISLAQENDDLILELRAQISELQFNLTQIQSATTSAPEKPSAPKRKYYRKPKGPKA